ncbi:MAG: EAL domain-containing protein [Mobilitalea sp.]
MRKKFQEFQDYHKRCTRIIILLCLDLIFLSLLLISTLFPIAHSHLLILIFIILNFICLSLTALNSRLNLATVKNLEDYFLKNSYGSSSNRIHKFHKLLDNNFFEYHFQPIVDAKTGEIFAYEALMRTPPEIDMMPVEILELADRENCFYDIEKFTFTNTLKIMKSYSDIFETKKLFVNSISSHQLTDADFNSIFNEYGPLLSNLVMEITESTHIDEDGLTLLHKRLKQSNCQLALDDYGTGYSNESNLLNSIPNYVKIDRSILRYINIDAKKQHLVSNLVDFALHNNIKIIAEGIETFEEFEFVINLGIDYIQGYYTANPSPVLLDDMPAELLATIHEINRKKYLETMSKKVYESISDITISPVALALEMFSNIIIYEEEITLLGNQDMVANTCIHIPDNHNCLITMDEINLCSSENPTITIGSNCFITLHLLGDNVLTGNGIRVPTSSSLTIIGDGNLSIQSNMSSGIGIGGTNLQSYGNITIASTGYVKVCNNADMSIGIGGGMNPDNSLLHFISGNIQVTTAGYQTLAIGSVGGNALIEINDCKLQIKSESAKTIGIGSMSGLINLKSSGDLDIRCEGRNVIAIGVFEKGEGSILLSDGNVNLHFKTHVGVGIGSIEGNVAIHIASGDIYVYGEGTNIVGIGDSTGKGEIKISDGIINTKLYAAHAVSMYTDSKKIIIDGGNIQIDFLEDIALINSIGIPLVSKLLAKTEDLIDNTTSYAYEYHAKYSDKYPSIRVYLPEYVS